MILTKLKIKNFKRFKDITEFDLSINNKDKNIILIEALNGVWKTSFLQAVQWAFFGLEKSEFKKYLNYESRDEWDYSIFIEIEFRDNNFQTCSIVRNYISNWIDGNLKETLELYINWSKKEFNNEEWKDYLNKTFPKEISNFFFFDWEKIWNLINPDDPKKIKSAIEKVLWIEVIRNLKDDLSELKSEVFKNINNEWLDKKIQTKKMQLEDYENKKAELKESILLLEKNILKDENSKNEILKNIEILAKSWLTKEKLDIRISLWDKLININNEITVLENDINVFKSNYLDTFLLTSFFDNLNEWIKKEELIKESIISSNLNDDSINKIIQELYIPTCIIWWEKFDISKSELIKDKIKYALWWDNKNLKNDIILDLNNKDKTNIGIAIDNINKSESINIDIVIDRKNVLTEQVILLKKEIADIDRQVDNSEWWLNNINELHWNLSNIDNILQKYNTELSNKLTDSEKIENEIKKIQKELESQISKVSLMDNDKKYFDLLSRTSEVFDTYVDQLIEKRKSDLESKTFEMFSSLVSQNIYKKIEISNNYEVVLFDSNWIAQKNLSAWQTQILMTSLLWWLESLSNFQLPIIIDTPLARLDPIHRKNMLEKYFHKAGGQVIILSQPAEITSNDKENILFTDYLKDNQYINMTFDENKMQSVISYKPIS